MFGNKGTYAKESTSIQRIFVQNEEKCKIKTYW